MSVPRVLAAAVLIATAAVPRAGLSDAIIRSQAMFATTIAEFFVEDERVYVELEIGGVDLRTFAGLLPDEMYAEIQGTERPREARLAEFFAEQLVVEADGRGPLRGRLLGLEPRRRVRRDALSGGSVAPDPNQPVDLVLFAQLEYPFRGRPETLGFHAPAGRLATSIGFLVYHRGIAVNDFRYLGARHILELDWDDPWYSRFQTRTMRRTYFAPMSGFVYVEPYEVRKEIIARPRDLQQWVDLGLDGRKRIPVELQPELKRRAAAFLREHQPVRIDGQPVEGELARIDFLERTLRTSRVIQPPVDLDLDSAMLGIIFVYPVDGLPQKVTMEWDLWNERIQLIPAASVDQAGPLPVLLEPDFHVLEWQNFLKNPELPTLTVLTAPPPLLARLALPLRWVFSAAAALTLAAFALRRRRLFAQLALAVGMLAALSFWLGRDAALTDERAREVVGGLLHNVYRAFDFRDDERVYDVLAHSVDGELLEQIYLETRRGLELASQGGARARVKRVELAELETEPREGGGFRARAVWNVAGAVGHWGHLHQRRNRYRAELDVADDGGAWKLVALEILEEERL